VVRQIWLIHRRESGGAFLLTRAGDSRWADLGPAAAMDRPVQDLIAANDWSASLAAKEAAGAKSAEQTAQDALRTLSQKLSPVIAQLAHHKEIARLRIAPDGMLNLAPFAALADARGPFLIQHHAISYVTASRDLTGVATAEPSGVRGHRGKPRSEPAIRRRDLQRSISRRASGALGGRGTGS
jgi:hypothetical protein